MAKRSAYWSGSFNNRLSGIDESGQRSNFFNIAYTTQGNAGPVVLMIHGFLVNRQEFFALQSLLSPYCRTIAIDLLGMGDSTKLFTGGTDLYSWKNDVAYIKAMMDSIYPNEQFLIIGDHWGSSIGFTYASLHQGDLFGVVNINSVVGSNMMGLTERQISRWSQLNTETFASTLQGFETTLSNTFRSFTTKPCVWSDKCLQVFLTPYYKWRSAGGKDITYTSTTTVPVDVSRSINTGTVGVGGVQSAVQQMTSDVSRDIAADIADDGVVDSSNVIDTAVVGPGVQRSLNTGLSMSQVNASLDPSTPATIGNMTTRGLPSIPVGSVKAQRTATTTTIAPTAGSGVNLNVRGGTTDVTVPAVVSVTKETDVSTGGKRMVADIDDHAVRVLSERARSSYRERTKPLTVDNDEGINYNRVLVPQMFITSCRHSLGVQGIGWKMMNELNQNTKVRVVELDHEGQLVVIENPKKIANIVIEFIANLIGASRLAARFDGYDQKPATSMCSWVRDSDVMYSYTVVNETSGTDVPATSVFMSGSPSTNMAAF